MWTREKQDTRYTQPRTRSRGDAHHLVPEVIREGQARQPRPAEHDVSELLVLVLACPSLDLGRGEGELGQGL